MTGRGWIVGGVVALIVASCASGSSEPTTATDPIASDTLDAVTTTPGTDPPPTDPPPTDPPATDPPPTDPPATDPPATDPPPTTEPPEPQPAYGGDVVLAADQEPLTLNPLVPGGDLFIVSILGQFYMTGVQDIDGETLELIPEVVTELPSVQNGGITVNPDGTMTVRYQISDDAVWADGVPISGDDFQFTYDTIMSPLPIDKTIYEDIVGTAVGPKTFEYTMSEPTTQAELIFDVLLPKHDVEGSDFVNDWNDRMWVSGGPFTFESWTPGESIRVVRNDNYWKTDEKGDALPYLDSVVTRFLPEDGAGVAAFTAREVDIANPAPRVEILQSLLALEEQGAEVIVDSGPIWEHLNFQFGDNRLVRNPASLAADVRLRRAVADAILDKRKIVDEVYGGLVDPLDSYVSTFSPTLSTDAWAQYDYDPARAAELVAELCAEVDCGAEGRPTLVFSTTSNNEGRVAMADLLVSMMDAAGIDLQLQLEDSSVFFGETLDFGRWDVGSWAWVGTPGLSGLTSIHDVFDPEAPPANGSNFYRWGTPAVSGQSPGGFNQGPSSVIDESTQRFAELVDLMGVSVDAVELAALIAEAEQLLADQVVMIPIFARPDPALVWADEVGGFVHNPSQAGDTWNAAEWHRVDL